MAKEDTGFRQTGSPVLPEGTVDTATYNKLAKEVNAENVTVQNKEEAQQVLDEKNALSVSKDFKLKAAPTVELSSLSPEKQAEYQKLVEEAEQTAEKEEEAPKKIEASSANKSLQLCPNCSWDQANRDTAEVTEDDKKMWLRHILGGTRFIKRYELFGKRVTVVLRGRTVAEQDLIMAQLDDDQSKKGEPLTPQLYLYWWSRYALAASLQSVQYLGKAVQSFPEILDSDGKKAYDGIEHSHYSLLAYVSKDKLAYWSDVLHNAVLACQQHFDKLCSRLQFQARNEDFFDGIDGEVF